MSDQQDMKSPDKWTGELSHLYALQKPKFESKAEISKTSFCVKCVTATPDIGYCRKLFSGVASVGNLPPPQLPEENTPESALAYLDAYRHALMHEIKKVTYEDAFEIGMQSAKKFGAHFSGKLIHSSMKGAAGFAVQNDTEQPYLSSRQLLRQGIAVPPDAMANDATGTYQRVIGIMREDGEAGQCGVPDEIIEAIRAGAEKGFADSKKSSNIDFVDSRARQILLPCGDGYLSVSPLVSGGMCQLIDDAVLKIEEDFARQLAEDIEAKSGTRKKGKVKDGDTGKQETAEPQKKNAPKRLYIRIDLGGANKQNITTYGIAVQNALLFESPQPDMVSRQVFRFLFHPWKPVVTENDWKIAKVGIERAINAEQPNSVQGVRFESVNRGLVALVMKCHQQASDLSFDLLDTTLKEDDDGVNENGDNRDAPAPEPDEIRIDENLLKTKRPNAGKPNDLDLAILNRNFNDVYCESMASAIIARLKYFANRNMKDTLIHYEVDISRITRAVVKILEGITK